jgi:electron transfer flavoprotein alpha/beta subunit
MALSSIQQGVQFIIGPYDDYALARAIELKEQIPGTTVTVIKCWLGRYRTNHSQSIGHWR